MWAKAFQLVDFIADDWNVASKSTIWEKDQLYCSLVPRLIPMMAIKLATSFTFAGDYPHHETSHE